MESNGVGQVTHFVSATPSFHNRELQNDATTSSTGEHTYYSTAPQELWTELLSKDLQDSNFVPETQNNEGKSSCVEVHMLKQSELVLVQLLAEGGQAHVYFARCAKFSTPVIVKRLKHGNVDLFRLQRRLEMVMKTRKQNNSAICRVFGVGIDFVGNAWVVMERMAGDLQTLIDRRMNYLEDGQMPFDYNNTITMMMHIAQGMEDLHRCDLIHADLKASNILVTPVIMDPREEEVDGSQQASESMYFYVKIGDFDTSDGVVGTRFWRAPEVLQALRNGAKPIISPAADVYSYGMLCYELLTGRIPFEKCARSDYNVVLSGQRPELPAHVNLTMKELLRACWHTEPLERPGWISIIKTLKEELILHPPGSQQTKRRAQPRIKMELKEIQAAATTSETSNLVVTLWEKKMVAQGRGGKFYAPGSSNSWKQAVAQGLGAEFATWKEDKKVVLEILPIVKAIFEGRKALRQDSTMLPIVKEIFEWRKALRQDSTILPIRTEIFERRKALRQDSTIMGYGVLYAFGKAWDLVKETWTNHVGRGFRPGELGTYSDGSEMETLEERQFHSKREIERMVREIWANEALEPYNLLGPTAENWLKEILATSKEWKAFPTTLNAWRRKNKGNFLRWKHELRRASIAWKEVWFAFHAWHVESPIAFIAWQALKNKERNWWEDDMEFFEDTCAEVYLKVHNAPEREATMESIWAWKAVEVEKVAIKGLFLENAIDIATQCGKSSILQRTRHVLKKTSPTG